MLTAKRSFPITFLDSSTQEVKITRGMLMFGLLLSAVFTANVTGLATSVRAIPVPFRRITILADNGRVLHTILGVDAVRKALLYEQTAQATLIVPPSGVAVAAYACEAHIPIFFKQPNADNGDLTDLPSWAYQDLTLRVEWGTHTDLFVGGAGNLTAVGGATTFTQLEAAGVQIPNPVGLARALGISVDRYKQVAAPNAVNPEFALDLSTTADIRAIMIVTEDANGEPTNAILDKVTLLENQNVRVYSGVPLKSLRADNAKMFGVSVPVGVAVIEFAEDRDIQRIYPASRKDTLSLVFGTFAVAGVIRAHLLTIERPLAA